MTTLKWAVKARVIREVPLVDLEMPPQSSRGSDSITSPEVHEQLVQAATPAYAMFLRVLWATGARPGEVTGVRAENFDPDAEVVRLKDHKTAHKSRTIYLTPESVALLRGLLAQHPVGALLRNTRGKEWSAKTLVKAMTSARKKAGIDHAIAYGYRHTFASEAMSNGVPDALVAELLGHSGTAMLHKHYYHLGQKSAVLRQPLEQVRVSRPEVRPPADLGKKPEGGPAGSDQTGDDRPS